MNKLIFVLALLVLNPSLYSQSVGNIRASIVSSGTIFSTGIWTGSGVVGVTDTGTPTTISISGDGSEAIMGTTGASGTNTTIVTGTLVLPKSIPDGTLEGTAAVIEGGTVSDANWSHLLITDTDKSVGRGGSISFGTGGNGFGIDPFASIKAIAEGDFFGSLGFFTRPDGGTNTQNMTILSTGFVGIGTASPTCTFEVSGGAQATSFRGTGNWGGAYTGGQGVEVGFDGVGFILAYDRDNSNYEPVEVSGSQVSLTTVGGSANIVVSGTGVTMGLQQLVPAIYPLSPTTGFTINAPADFADQTHYLTPAGPLATGAFILPDVADSIDGQFIRVFTDRAITAFTFTVSGGGVIQGSSTGLLGLHDTATFQRVSGAGTGTWIRIK